jgi:carbon monoxide dehydrogenase subunit G
VKFAGRYLISASRQKVWEALNDTEVLKSCIPGCTRMEFVAPDELEAEMGVQLGPVKLTFNGELKLTIVTVAERYMLAGRGRSGWIGGAKGSADISLADDPGGTVLSFEAEGEADSSIANFGANVVGRSAQGVIDRFFERFAGAIGASSRSLLEG